MPKNRIYVAIDPGLRGAVAVLKEGGVVAVLDMPIAAKKSGSKEVDPQALLEFFDGDDVRTLSGDVYVLIERVSAMPGQGVSSMFSLGDSFGTARALATVFAHRLDYVSPVSWKRSMGLTKDKKYSLGVARRMFPDALHYLRLEKHEGRAEALLLAKYAATEHAW